MVATTITNNGHSGVTSTNLFATATNVRKLHAEMNDLFPEREALITQLIYGLLTREHVLVYGTFGTGKSRLVDRFFGSFTGTNMFSVELTKFMTESNIVGIPNPKILREEGRIWHERQGTMLDAHFGELDELFDANDHLLRTLLGILNERRFNRGVQRERANLHMALASTNADPVEQVKRSASLGAVVDRFLFQTEVTYLASEESRRKMYAKFLSDTRPAVLIPYSDIQALADAVVRIPIDPMFIDLHEKIVQGFQKASRTVFSDRRACQAFKLAQADAVLYGRSEIVPDDFLATMWAFCKGHDIEAQETYKRVATPLVEQAVKGLQPDVVRTQMKLLEELEKRLPQVVGNSQPSADELVAMRRALVQLGVEVKDIKPSHTTIEDRQKQLLISVDGMKNEVGKLIDGEVVI